MIWQGCLAVVAFLLSAAPEALASLPEIRGTIHRGDSPVPGALVVLYDASDFLVDSTYTTDQGEFRLLPPPHQGRFYVVATSDGSSRRAAFEYDPAAGKGRRVRISLPEKQESLLRRAGSWLLNEFGSGLLLGYLFRLFVEERVTAKRKRDDFLSDLRAAVSDALSQFPAAVPESRLGEITGAVRQIRQLLDRRADMAEVLPALKILNKEKARAGFRALNDKLRSVESDLAESAGAATIPKRAALDRVKQSLIEMRDLPFG